MPRYTYEAVDTAGLASKGELEAGDRRAAARRLAAKGLRVSRLGEAKSKRGGVAEGGEDHPLLHKARPLGVHPTAFAFVGGFAELHEGGMPVGDAVKLMAVRVTEPSLRALCKGLWRDLSEGISLSAALTKRPVVFDEATVHLVAAGEATGNLVPVLTRVRESYETREAMRSKIIGALAYPAILTLTAIGVLALFVFMLMPVMEKLMGQLGGEFPWYVKGLMFFASVFVKGLPVFAVVAAVVGFRLNKARSDAGAKRRQDALALRIPLVGKALVHAEAARLAELISTLLGSGVNAAQALRLAEKPIANTELRARFGAARRRVHDGTAISTALGDTGVFEPEDLDLASVGEDSGTLPRAFASVATRRRKAFDATLARLVKTLTAVFFGLVITLVGFCLVSIITTSLSVSKNITTRR